MFLRALQRVVSEEKVIFSSTPYFLCSMLTGAWRFVVDEVVALFFCYLHLKAK